MPPTLRGRLLGFVSLGLAGLATGGAALAQGTATAGDRGAGAPAIANDAGAPTTPQDPRGSPPNRAADRGETGSTTTERAIQDPSTPRSRAAAASPAAASGAAATGLLTAHALEMALKGAGMLESARMHAAQGGDAGPAATAVQQLRRQGQQAFTESDRLFSMAESATGDRGAAAMTFQQAARDYARTVRTLATSGGAEAAAEPRERSENAANLDGQRAASRSASAAEACVTNLGVCDVVSAYCLRQAAGAMPEGTASEALRQHAREMDQQGREALGIASGGPGLAGGTPAGAATTPATSDPSLYRTRGRAGVDSQGNAGAGVETTGPVGGSSAPGAVPTDLAMQARKVVQAIDALGSGAESPANPGAGAATTPAAASPAGSGLETGFGNAGSPRPTTPPANRNEAGTDRPAPTSPAGDTNGGVAQPSRPAAPPTNPR